MHESTARIRQYRRAFGWVFVLSLPIFLLSNVIFLAAPAPASNTPPDVHVTPPGGGSGGGGGGGNSSPSNSGSPKPPHPSSSSTDLSLYISAASLLTSTASFAGFLFTSIVTWRKERREQRHADVDLEKKKLEVEKLKRELGQKRE